MTNFAQICEKMLQEKLKTRKFPITHWKIQPNPSYPSRVVRAQRWKIPQSLFSLLKWCNFIKPILNESLDPKPKLQFIFSKNILRYLIMHEKEHYLKRGIHFFPKNNFTEKLKVREILRNFLTALCTCVCEIYRNLLSRRLGDWLTD